MKSISAIVFFLLWCGLTTTLQAQSENINIVGAWQTISGQNKIVMICSDKYFAAAVYDRENKTFLGTCGGRYTIENNAFIEVHEFNTMKPELVGKELKNKIELKNGKLIFNENTENKEWTLIDNGTPGELAGAWLITGRMQGDKMSSITPGVRRTMKILSGTRFQWIAYNIETKEFFGTGGGTYTTQDGKYSENIEFFSRDNSRVGKKLQFDFSWQEGRWRHQGLSSKGDTIDEVWTKREKLSLDQ
jgi:hypothetical protein